MNIGILGTGMVGRALGTALAAEGHAVTLGSRTADNAAAATWAAAAGPQARAGTFADAAEADVIISCTSGQHSLSALAMAGAERLAGKVLIDVSNPLDFSTGELKLTVANDDSLAEQIQRAYPEAKVVKALNMMSNSIMVAPGKLEGPHDIFICGDDDAAKASVSAWLTEWFGWGAAIDLGDLAGARGQEAWLLLWVRMWKALGTADFNIRIVRAAEQP